MTTQDYLKQNKAGFENDIIARERFKHIIESNKIDTIIETGTYLGSTTLWLSQWAEQVHTIEVKQEHFNQAKEVLKDCKNVSMYFGNSADKLKEVLLKIAPIKEADKEKFIQYKKVFLFLDAHWEDYNPLLKELDVISQFYIQPFIAIHDFKVPNHPELGFDSYKGQDYDFDWIKEGIEKIYGKTGYKVKYNSEATGAKRGICYLSKNEYPNSK